MKNGIRFGVIGCSSIAERTTIPAIKEVNYAKLQMVGSRSREKAERFAEKFSCDLFGDYDEVLETNDVDAVYISLPPSLNEKWVIKSAKAGKHILCEKPTSISYKSAKKMIHECKKNGVRMLEGFSFRFHPQHAIVLKIIRENILGKLFSFSGSYGFNLPYTKENFRFRKELGGGVLNDVGCYLVCASRIIFQDKLSSILCNLDIDKKTGVDVNGSIHITYSDKHIAVATFGYDTFFRSTYSVWGNKGFVNLKRAFNIRKNMSASINLETENGMKHMKLRPANQSKLMIEEFCKELSHSRTSTFNYESDLLVQAQVMEAGRQSYLKKQRMYVKEI